MNKIPLIVATGLISIIVLIGISAFAYGRLIDAGDIAYQDFLDKAAPPVVPDEILSTANEGLKLLKDTYKNDPPFYDIELDHKMLEIGDHFCVNSVKVDMLRTANQLSDTDKNMWEFIDTSSDEWYFTIKSGDSPVYQLEIFHSSTGEYIVGPFGGDQQIVSAFAHRRQDLLADLASRQENGSDVSPLISVFWGPSYYYYAVIDGQEVATFASNLGAGMLEAMEAVRIEGDTVGWYPAVYLFQAFREQLINNQSNSLGGGALGEQEIIAAASDINNMPEPTDTSTNSSMLMIVVGAIVVLIGTLVTVVALKRR